MFYVCWASRFHLTICDATHTSSRRMVVRCVRKIISKVVMNGWPARSSNHTRNDAGGIYTDSTASHVKLISQSSNSRADCLWVSNIRLFVWSVLYWFIQKIGTRLPSKFSAFFFSLSTYLLTDLPSYYFQIVLHLFQTAITSLDVIFTS